MGLTIIRTVFAPFLKEIRAALALIMCVALAGCGTTLSGIVKGDKSVAGEESRTQVLRNQKALTGKLPIALRTGDEVLTDSESTAIIRYATGSEVYLRPGSRVRISSLTCTGFCDLLVKAKGFFRVDTAFAKAGTEGTSFWVKFNPDRSFALTVIEGVVKIESDQGADRKAGWQPVSLSAAQRVDIGSTGPPKTRPATVEELEEVKNWAEKIERLAPKTGLTTGQTIGIGAAIAAAIAIIAVSRSGGDDEDKDDRQRPEGGRPADGYCCAGGQVSAATRTACASINGRYFTNANDAQRECRKPYRDPRIRERIYVPPAEPAIR